MKLFAFESFNGRKYLALLLLILCPTFAAKGQFYSQGRFWQPNPQVSNFIKYTDLSSVDYYTGTVNVNIPFYTYKDNDFELPVSFSYSSNGYRPNIPAGPVGMGWFINTGGFITREVRGLKDEAGLGFHKWHKNGNPDYSDIKKQGSADEPKELTHIDEITKQRESSNTLWIDNGRWRYKDNTESEPDIFTFNFFGHKGKFSMGPRKVFIYATNNPSGEYNIDLTDFPTKIIIKTGDGYTYTFEKTDSKMGRYGPEYDNDEQLNSPLLYWPLTNIKAPNGREVAFNYTEPEKSQKSTPSYHSTGTSDNTWQNWGSWLDDYNSDHESEVKEKQELETEYVVHLQDIQIGDFKIDFNYVPRQQETIYYKRDGRVYEENCETMSILNSVDIINTKNNDIIKQASLDYHIAGNGNPLQFLKSIEINNEEKYEMSYFSTHTFPRHGTTGIDYFGFYNNRLTYKISDLFPGASDPLNPSRYSSQTREPSFQGAIKGMLSEVIYPTGGRTRYYYEANDYSAFIKKDRNVLLNEDNTARIPTGGVRIKRITDYSTPADSTYRDFDYSYYDKEDGSSSGIKLHTFRYTESYNISYEFEFKFDYYRYVTDNRPERVEFTQKIGKHIFVNMKNSNGIIPSTRDKSHIEYPEVIERRQDGSCIVYGFTSYKNRPDKSSTYWFSKSLGHFPTYNPDYIDNYLKEYDDYSNQRGKPMHVKQYNANGKLIKEIKYNYDTGRNLATFPTVRPSVYSYYYNNIVVDDYLLSETVKTDYLFGNYQREKTKLSYNSKKQIVEEETTFENYYETQKWVLNKYQYVSDLPSSEKTAVHTFMENNNVVKNPIRTQTSAKQTKNGNYRIIKANKFDYEAKTVGNNNMVNLSKHMDASNDIPTDCADFNFDNYLHAKYTYKYNYLGHVIEVIDRANIPSSYIWGYNGLYIVALMENVTIKNLKNINGLEEVENFVFEEGIPENVLNMLYGQNNNSATTVFYYKPYVGLAKMIAPTQRINFYEYDSTGRLIKALNERSEPISEYEYNIGNSNN